MSCMFFSFVLVYLYVSQCTLTWKNGYVERLEFKQKIKSNAETVIRLFDYSFDMALFNSLPYCQMIAVTLYTVFRRKSQS